MTGRNTPSDGCPIINESCVSEIDCMSKLPDYCSGGKGAQRGCN